MSDGFFNDNFFPKDFWQEHSIEEVVPEAFSKPSPGFFHSNFFPRQFFQENVWQEYGTIEEFIEVLSGLGVDFGNTLSGTMHDLKTGELYPMPLRQFSYKPTYTELKDHELVYVEVGGVKRLVIRDGILLRACILA